MRSDDDEFVDPAPKNEVTVEFALCAKMLLLLFKLIFGTVVMVRLSSFLKIVLGFGFIGSF